MSMTRTAPFAQTVLRGPAEQKNGPEGPYVNQLGGEISEIGRALRAPQYAMFCDQYASIWVTRASGRGT